MLRPVIPKQAGNYQEISIHIEDIIFYNITDSSHKLCRLI